MIKNNRLRQWPEKKYRQKHFKKKPYKSPFSNFGVLLPQNRGFVTLMAPLNMNVIGEPRKFGIIKINENEQE